MIKNLPPHFRDDLADKFAGGMATKLQNPLSQTYNKAGVSLKSKPSLQAIAQTFPLLVFTQVTMPSLGGLNIGHDAPENNNEKSIRRKSSVASVLIV